VRVREERARSESGSIPQGLYFMMVGWSYGFISGVGLSRAEFILYSSSAYVE